MSIIRNRLYQFKQELLSNKDRAWYSHTNLLTAVDLLITDLDNLDESDWIRVNDEMPVERDSMFAKFKGTNKWKTGMFEKVSRNVLVTVEYDNGERHTEVAHGMEFRAYICGNVIVKDDAADVYFTNSEEFDVWLKLRVLTANGTLLGETGLIRPGEYVKSVSLTSEVEDGTAIKLKIMAYEPDTYYSAGSVTLNTILREEGAE